MNTNTFIEELAQWMSWHCITSFSLYLKLVISISYFWNRQETLDILNSCDLSIDMFLYQMRAHIHKGTRLKQQVLVNNKKRKVKLTINLVVLFNFMPRMMLPITSNKDSARYSKDDIGWLLWIRSWMAEMSWKLVYHEYNI